MIKSVSLCRNGSHHEATMSDVGHHVWTNMFGQLWWRWQSSYLRQLLTGATAAALLHTGRCMFWPCPAWPGPATTGPSVGGQPRRRQHRTLITSDKLQIYCTTMGASILGPVLGTVTPQFEQNWSGTVRDREQFLRAEMKDVSWKKTLLSPPPHHTTRPQQQQLQISS